jgi:tetratricopeptide (TPR) repeat protein
MSDQLHRETGGRRADNAADSPNQGGIARDQGMSGLLLARAVSLDPEYAEAYRWLAMNHWMGWVHSGGPTEANRGAALELARKAVAIDPDDAGCRWVLAYLLAYERRFAEADQEFAKAIDLDPNEADAWAALSDIAVLAGRVEEGLEHIRKAFRLNPFPASWYYLALGQAQYAAGEYEAAVETLRRDETYRTSSRRFLAGSLAQLGRLEQARARRSNFSSSATRFSRSVTGLRRSRSATQQCLSILLMASAGPVSRNNAPASVAIEKVA